MRLLLLLASAAAISKVPKAPTAGRAAAISSKTPQKPTTGRAAAKTQAEEAKPLALSGGGANKQVSYAWAVLHNWLYFLSLGFNLINIQFLVRDIVEWLKVINEC